MVRKNGFTLIELLVVIALIMILATVGIGTYTVATVKSKDTQRKGDLSQIVRALESFNNDVGRYPVSTDDAMAPGDDSNQLHCYLKANGVATDPICTPYRLSSTIDGVTTTYMTLPADPDPSLSYIYVSADGSSYALYTAIENTSDKDLLANPDGSPNLDPWGIACGSSQCNYKLTEAGLSKEQ